MTAGRTWHGSVRTAAAPLAGVLVTDGRTVVRTGADGLFELPHDPDARFVFITTPRGHQCAVWAVATAEHDPTGPLTFVCDPAPERDTPEFALVHVSDIHVCVDHEDSGDRIGDSVVVIKHSTGKRGDAPLTRWDDLAADLGRVAQQEPDALAFLITGDLANSGQLPEHEAFARALAAAPLPARCIPGNHDYMDEQARERNYEAVLGPRYYSFDIGEVHFVATDWWEMDRFPDQAERQLAWIANDLREQPVDAPIVVLSHDQLTEEQLAPFRTHRVIATFSGHKHATRVYDDGRTVHFNIPTFMFGAYDHSPRCYRVARFSGDAVRVETKSLHDDPAAARFVFSACGGSGAQRDSAAPTVQVRDAWPQFHGGAGRGGVVAHELSPPLTRAWTAPLGEGLNLGGPVVTGNTVIVGLQREDAPGGALVALEAATGRERWRVPVANAIKRTPAAVDGLVIAATVSGEVLAADVATGEVQWRYQLGDPSKCWIYTAPVITDGVVCIGEAFHFAALDVRTGQPRWVRTDFGDLAEFINMSSPAAADGKVFASFFWQQDNFAALDVRTGATLWAHREGRKRAAMCGAAAVHGRVYVSRVTMDLECLDADTGDLHWRSPIGAIFTQATPCVTPHVVYAVGGLGTVRALDAATGKTCWAWQAEEAALETAPYMRATPNTVASPVLAGRYLYVPSNCGRLTALDTDTGDVAWSYDFGVPLPGSPAASGNTLFVPAADGTLTALVAS